MEITDRSVAKFVADLARDSPTIRRISQDSLVLGSDGEVRLHNLFAMATPYLQELADHSLHVSSRKEAALWGSPPSTDAETQRELLAVLAQLERWYEPANLPLSGRDKNDPADDGVSNAIALSFIEGLPLGELSEVVELLGPKLRRSHERFWREGLF